MADHSYGSAVARLSPLDVVVIEPWYRGSHRSWADGWESASSHRVTLLALEGERWRRALLTTPFDVAERLSGFDGPIDCLVASTPVDLAGTLGLARRRVGDIPVVLYAHETQVSYPPGPDGGSAPLAAAADWRAMVAADLILVASEYHRGRIVEQLPAFVRELHGDGALTSRRIEETLAKIEVLPVGVAPLAAPSARRSGPARILWNHRWAHDKAPDRFVHALARLAGERLPFEVCLLGQVERSGRQAYRRAIRMLGARVIYSGHQGRTAYADILAEADIVVSTADHEFFGVAVVEAMTAGCRPVLPDRLSYPELLPPGLRHELLYTGDLASALRPLVSGPPEAIAVHQEATMAAACRFAWDQVAPAYDARLASLVATR